MMIKNFHIIIIQINTWLVRDSYEIRTRFVCDWAFLSKIANVKISNLRFDPIFFGGFSDFW